MALLYIYTPTSQSSHSLLSTEKKRKKPQLLLNILISCVYVLIPRTYGPLSLSLSVCCCCIFLHHFSLDDDYFLLAFFFFFFFECSCCYKREEFYPPRRPLHSRQHRAEIVDRRKRGNRHVKEEEHERRTQAPHPPRRRSWKPQPGLFFFGMFSFFFLFFFCMFHIHLTKYIIFLDYIRRHREREIEILSVSAFNHPDLSGYNDAFSFFVFQPADNNNIARTCCCFFLIFCFCNGVGKMSFEILNDAPALQIDTVEKDA